jgi:hypothetical protein
MIQVEQADYIISIGIKKGKVIGIDWAPMLQCESSMSMRIMKRRLMKYLLQATRMVKTLD